MDTLQTCEIRDHSRRQEKAYFLTVRILLQTNSGEWSLEVLSVPSLRRPPPQQNTPTFRNEIPKKLLGSRCDSYFDFIELHVLSKHTSETYC